MDPEGWWLLGRMQQTSARVTPLIDGFLRPTAGKDTSAQEHGVRFCDNAPIGPIAPNATAAYHGQRWPRTMIAMVAIAIAT